MVIASIQLSTFSPLTVKPLSVTASTLPWDVYDFAFPFALSWQSCFTASVLTNESQFLSPLGIKPGI